MPYETFSSGLTIQAPTAGTKNWAETLRSELWAKISAHDHTGSGKGLQIATAAIANEAVTEAKLHADAATRSCSMGRFSNPALDGSLASVGLVLVEGTSLLTLTLPKACKVTHLSLNASHEITGGTLTVTLFKNGSTTGKTLVLSSGTETSGSIVAESFATGDEIGVRYTTDSAVFDSGGTYVSVTPWGHFIE